METQRFRGFLERELTRRMEDNPSYSLRAFAQHLDVDPSLLSKVITNKRKPSNAFVEKVGLRLGLKPKDLHEDKSDPFLTVTQDLFEQIADPIHYCLLELLETKNFRNEPRWMAKRLKRKVTEVHAAIARLKRLNLLEETPKNGLLDKTDGKSSHVLGPNITSEAHKQYQERILKKAQKALFEIDFTKRDQSSITVATTTKKIKEAKEKIKNFRRELCTFLNDSTEKTDVYTLSISLFPETNTKKEEE